MLNDPKDVIMPEDERPLQHNPEPLDVVHTPRCRRCRRHAPWCKCGAADYDDLPDSDDRRAVQ